MDKEFVPYMFAVKLRNCGFDELCFSFYYPNGDGHRLNQDCGVVSFKWNKNIFKTTNSPYVPAPLYQQAFRFIRKKYGLFCDIVPNADDAGDNFEFKHTGKFSGAIEDIEIDKVHLDTDTICLIPTSNSYEDAELNALIKLFKIIDGNIEKP